ncbi:MAG: hypothetical protein AB1611_15780 [bacterium]
MSYLMTGSFWVIQAIFFLGLFHGLRGDHIIDILNSRKAQDIYQRPSWVSLKVGLIHLGHALTFVVPLWLLRIKLSGLSCLSSRPALGSAFWALGLQSFYEFFWVPPKQLHQHEHPHEHEHGHLHSKPVKSAGREGGEHADHFHVPRSIDKPGSTPLDHQHPHAHRHEHLHYHTPEEERSHHHQHYSSGQINRLAKLQNILSLLAVSMTALVFPLPGILISLAAFLVGLFLAVYFLGIVYRGKGIDLMSRIDRLSAFLLGAICGLAGLWLFVAGI